MCLFSDTHLFRPCLARAPTQYLAEGMKNTKSKLKYKNISINSFYLENQLMHAGFIYIYISEWDF